MQFENSFEVPLPPEQAWSVLLDVPRVAPCLPGAELTEALGNDQYKGRAAIKVGPVNLYFAGDAEIVSKDEASRTARVRAKGSDTKQRGQANAVVDFALQPHGEGTRVTVKTDLNLTGAVAQYGRASGLMKEIAATLLNQFAQNLRNELKREGDAVAARAQAETAAPGSQAARPRVGDAPPNTTAPRTAQPLPAFTVLWIAIKSLVLRWLGLRRDEPRA
jgi:uncharacterized protein